MPNTSLLLPIVFDQKRLLMDLSVCDAGVWKDHFHKEVFSGNWNSIALYSPSGSSEDIFTENNDVFKPTPLLDRCIYFKEILDSMLFTKQSVRLLRLCGSSEIKTHRDFGLCYGRGIFRLHIPLSTDDKVDFIIGGERVVMNPAECWYGDFDQPHSVVNAGEKDRIHLVIDGERNEWTDALFAKAGYDFEAEVKQDQPDPETKEKIIKELLSMNTPTAHTLANQLMNEQ